MNKETSFEAAGSAQETGIGNGGTLKKRLWVRLVVAAVCLCVAAAVIISL